jgi:hypothetical protein
MHLPVLFNSQLNLDYVRGIAWVGTKIFGITFLARGDKSSTEEEEHPQ